MDGTAEGRTSVPSNMVSAGSRFSRPGYTQAQIALAQQLSTQHRIQLPTWNPRSGRSMKYQSWLKAVERVASVLSIRLDRLDEEPPKSSQSATRTASEQGDTARQDWLARDTMLYDVVQPSLELVGTDAERDTRRIDGLTTAEHGQGRKLVAWAIRFADVSSLAKQTKIRLAISEARLKATASRAQISSFLQRLHELWLLDNTTVPGQPHSYWSRVLMAMPTEPQGSHMVTLRTWLAEAVAKYEKRPSDPTFLTIVDDAIDDILDHAELIGMPAGAATAGGDSLAYIDLSLTGEAEAHEQGEQLHALGAPTGRNGAAGGQRRGRQFGADGKPANLNDCGFCDSYACQSRKRGGAFLNCICHKDSSFNTDKIGRSPARFIKMARAWHRSNPSATSLKGVRFSLKPPAASGGAPPTPPRQSMQAIGVPAPANASLRVEELFGDSAAGSQEEFDAWLASVESAGSGCLLALSADAPPSALEVVAEPAAGRAERDGDADEQHLRQQLQQQLQAAQLAAEQQALQHQRELALERAAADDALRRLAEANDGLAAAGAAVHAAKRYGTPLSALALPEPSPPPTKALEALSEPAEAAQGGTPVSMLDNVRSTATKLLFDSRSGDSPTKTSVTEHLAKALLINESQLTKLRAKVSARAGVRRAADALARVINAILTLGLSIGIKHWLLIAAGLKLSAPLLVSHLSPMLKKVAGQLALKMRDSALRLVASVAGTCSLASARTLQKLAGMLLIARHVAPTMLLAPEHALESLASRSPKPEEVPGRAESRPRMPLAEGSEATAKGQGGALSQDAHAASLLLIASQSPGDTSDTSDIGSSVLLNPSVCDDCGYHLCRCDSPSPLPLEQTEAACGSPMHAVRQAQRDAATVDAFLDVAQDRTQEHELWLREIERDPLAGTIMMLSAGNKRPAASSCSAQEELTLEMLLSLGNRDGDRVRAAASAVARAHSEGFFQPRDDKATPVLRHPALADLGRTLSLVRIMDVHYRTLAAVLAQLHRPALFTSEDAAMSACGARKSAYFKHKKLLKDLVVVNQIDLPAAAAQASSSSAQASSSSAAGKLQRIEPEVRAHASPTGDPARPVSLSLTIAGAQALSFLSATTTAAAWDQLFVPDEQATEAPWLPFGQSHLQPLSDAIYAVDSASRLGPEMSFHSGLSLSQPPHASAPAQADGDGSDAGSEMSEGAQRFDDWLEWLDATADEEAQRTPVTEQRHAKARDSNNSGSSSPRRLLFDNECCDRVIEGIVASAHDSSASDLPFGLMQALHGCDFDHTLLPLADLAKTDRLSDVVGSQPLPPEAIRLHGGTRVAALCDDGASLLASCTKLRDGAIPGTKRDDRQPLTVGNAQSLASLENNVHLYKRYASDGSGEIVARRMKLTPELPMAIVFAEPNEVYGHNYSISFDRDNGRVLASPPPASQRLPLHMSAAKLGWFTVQPVTDAQEAVAWLRRMASERTGSLNLLGDGVPKSLGMGTAKLAGVAFLRRWHAAHGHLSVRRMLLTLKAADKLSRFTRADLQQFVREGCGSCESSKMRRRAFTLRTIEDHTKPPPGKKWIGDSLELRVPTAGHGFQHIFLFVDAGSGKKFVTGVLGLTSSDVAGAHDRLRAFVRPAHGDIFIVIKDSHPTNRGQLMADYHATARQRNHLSPPYVHEGVSLAENAFMIYVPLANAQLEAAVDLDESHFYSSFLTAVSAGDDAITVGSDPPSSPNMRYEGRQEWRDSPLLVYGSPAKALVHPEARDSKYNRHSFACVYTGPAHNSASLVHCSVWEGKRYVDVDLGCINVDERAIIARTARDHPSHQPFGQAPGAAAGAPLADVSTWYNPADEAHPADASGELASSDALSALPFHRQVAWTSALAGTLPEYFSIDLCSGAPREGDVASWVRDSTAGRIVHLRIDLKVGGHEHNILRPDVAAALVRLASMPACLGVQMALSCGPWSAARFAPLPGAPHRSTPIFTSDAPNGVLLNGATHPDAVIALAKVQAGLSVAAAVLSHGGWVLSETPASQGAGSPYSNKAIQRHSSMHQTSLFRAFVAKHGLRGVYTDQCESGAKSRKPTHILCTADLLPMAQHELGVRVCSHKHSSEDRLVGANADGSLKTGGSERYTPLLSERLATIICSSASYRAALERGGNDQSNDNDPLALDNTQSTVESDSPPTPDANDPLPVNSRVEVMWTDTSTWWPATVVETSRERTRIKGRLTWAPIVRVKYDSDSSLHWHALHNTSIRTIDELAMPDLSLITDDLFEHSALLEKSHHMESVLFTVEPAIDVLTHERVTSLDCHAMLDGAAATVTAASASKETKPQPIYNYKSAHTWHEPRNERELERSPQRDLWITARELKWSEYVDLNMFSWVAVSQIDRQKYRVYNTLWVYKIKFNADLTFKKLNPRWCVKGGTMDRDVYKSFAETLRMSTFKILLAVKAGYYRVLCSLLADCSNAFQATRTDVAMPSDGSSSGEQLPDMYVWPAAGFERRSPSGERMALKLHVGMQGRIDATRLFNKRLGAILRRAGLTPSLWDPQLYIFDNSPLRGTDASLSELLKSCRGAADSEAQQPPVGYAIVGWHVDDGIGLACDVHYELDPLRNRVCQYIVGLIQVTYATTLTGWHGNKALGFLLECDDAARTVTMSAPDTLALLARDLLQESVTITPRHAMTEDFFDIPPGTVPPAGDPSRDAVLSRMALTRHALGVCIWLSNAYPKLVTPTNVLCANMAFPHERTTKSIRHTVMHLVKYPDPCRFGGWPCDGLEQPEELIPPFTPGRKAMYFHFFSDANLGVRSMSGGVAMLAGGPIAVVCQRQHLASPDSHTSEVVSAGNNSSLCVAINGVLQELRIRLGKPVPFYLDSMTTVFVSTNDTAVKKSVWLIRRVAVLTDAVKHNQIRPLHVRDPDMIADAMTKYLTFTVWNRHMGYMLNRDLHNGA